MSESNSVFISYRRDASAYLTLAVYQDLHTNGIDAFYDIESIDAGRFDMVILNQIAARPYFILVLTPGTLERCGEANDWVRRELEHALSLKRVIVPLHTPEFDFGDIERYLPAATAVELRRFNAVEVPHRYFRYAMADVRTRFLKPIDLPTTPAPAADMPVVAQQVEKIQVEPPVTDKQMTAQEYFERGKVHYYTGDYAAAIADWSETIRFNPEYAAAYYNRGIARKDQGDLDGAIVDWSEAIRLDPQDTSAYYNRGYARKDKGDLDGAVADYNEALRLNPQDTKTYYNRGNVLKVKGELDEAIADYDAVLRLNPQYAYAYNNRGSARQAKGDLDGAIEDYTQALHLNPADTNAYYNRALARADKQDYAGAVVDGQKFLNLQVNDPDAETIRRKIADWSRLIKR